MSGRRQAITATLILGVLPLINLLSPISVALIMLRRGAREALLVGVWAMLPLAAWATVGNVYPLLLLFGVTAMGWLLRETESWQLALLAAIAVGLSIEMYLRVFPNALELLYSQMEQYARINAVPGIDREALQVLLPSVIGACYMFVAIVLLIAARWLQARLYNPGGFQQEFRQLRLDQRVALLLVVLMIITNLGVVIPGTWMLYLVIPLVFTGVALVHGVVAKKQLPGTVLVVFYVVLMLPLALQLLIVAALLDSWYDFRSKIPA